MDADPRPRAGEIVEYVGPGFPDDASAPKLSDCGLVVDVGFDEWTVSWERTTWVHAEFDLRRVEPQPPADGA